MEDEKTLEDIDLPLRHFFLASDDLDGSDLLLPAPAPSIRDRIVQINFEAPLHRTIALSLSVDPGPGCGGIAWPAGEVLATYIAKRGSALDGQNVLELGSGTGLVGLVAGHLGAHVCITDQAHLIPIMERNILLNRLESNVTAAELDWCVLHLIFKVIAPRFTRVVFPILPHQSSGQSRFLNFSIARTSSSQPIAYTWKLLSRSSSRLWSRLSHLPRNGLPRCWSASRNAGKPISASSLCSKHISPGYLCRSIMTMMLKRDRTVMESRCCVYFAVRKRENSWFRTADESHRPRVFPMFADQSINLIMRTIAHTDFDQLLSNDLWGVELLRGVDEIRHHTSASTTHDFLRSMRLRRMTHSSQLRHGNFPQKPNGHGNEEEHEH